MTEHTRRLGYLAAVVVMIALGLAWRRPELGLSGPIAKYGGSILWGAMVFFCIGALAPRVDIVRSALAAAVVAALVEFSQAVRYGPLDHFRSTTFGALLLGRTFSWWDIAAYWVGVAAASLIVAAFAPQPRRPGAG